MSIFLDFEQTKRMLPQRYPFLMVDRVTEYVPGEKIVAVKNVTGNEPYFQGHFPEEAIMPGALILEGMAQTAILFFRLSQPDSQDQGKRYLFGEVKAKFISPVVPGDTLKFEVIPIKLISIGAIVKAVATVGTKIVTKAELSFSAKGLDK